MKKFTTKYLPFILIAISVFSLLPGLITRVQNETMNKNVVMSVLYSDAVTKLSESELDKFLSECLENGLNTVSVTEDDIGYLVNKGDVTCIKYNVLRHKYDDESMELASLIAEKCPEITYDSHIVIASRDDAKKRFAEELPRRYSSDEYASIGTMDDLDIFVLYDGKRQLKDYSIGYNRETLDKLSQAGFRIALVHNVRNHSVFSYIDSLDALIKEYHVEYLNLKEDVRTYEKDEIIKENYQGLANVINDNNMTLVVTENFNHLSNQDFIGHSYVYDQVTKNGGTNKIMRSFETYDDGNSNDTHYTHRVEQFLNSTVDRSLRFMTVTQITDEHLPYTECAKYTLKAATTYRDKIIKLGYTVNQEPTPFDYHVNRKLSCALCAFLMVLCLLLIYRMITEQSDLKTTLIALLVAVGGFGISYLMPASLLAYYPAFFCMIQSCTAITAIFYLIKKKGNALNTPLLILYSLLIMLGILLTGALCLGTLLSGLDYYINNLIFKGTKVTLIVPTLYAIVLYYVMFIKEKDRTVLQDICTALTAQIKVYWMLLAAVISAVGVYYIIRSGNVSSISSIEETMRSTVTEIFSVRPRTKEFLIGYPAFILFLYYVKKFDFKLLHWLLAIAVSILVASISNSYCHVFTGFLTIIRRTMNGLILGLPVAAVAYVCNLALVKVVQRVAAKYNLTRR